MVNPSPKLTILNESEGKWAFEKLAHILERALWVDISDRPSDLNYVLCTDSELVGDNIESFIPIESIKIAGDKRKIEQRFKTYDVTRPRTIILRSIAEIESILASCAPHRWVLKYPTGCGGIHHRIIEDVSQIPDKWPQPFLLQEFIESDLPAVYRLYCVDRDLFGFNARKFADVDRASPWVAHANGARYDYTEAPTQAAIEVAKSALIATGLYDSFGVVDLLRDLNGKWYALEVGTDGIYNHVDRDFDNDNLTDELNERLAIAMWKNIGTPPWGKSWKYCE
jgi:glutathione synthase/RimK-type ligase-like ATP-grasp enzyme